jgi:hypothetical protein
MLADALRMHEPWLEWAGKREKQGFAVDPVALHIHECITLGRGLDFFQKATDRYTPDWHDYTLRKCKATPIIFIPHDHSVAD